MTAELEELLAAAKVMFMTNTEAEAGMLHRAITAFEIARRKSPPPVQMPLIRVMMREDEIPASIYKGVVPLGDHNDVFRIEVYRVAKKPMPTAPAPYAPDPYDFENNELRKEP
jgi:hypothetical protein